MGSIVVFYIPAPKGKAHEMVQHLLNKKLIACANIVPSRSLYWWEGKLVDEEEEIILAKTTKEKGALVRKEVEKIHPYTVPCILAMTGTVNEIYGKWVEEETKGEQQKG